MYLQRTQVEQIARKLAPEVIQRVGGGIDPEELISLTVGVSAVETNGTYYALAKNPSSTARGVMQVLICSQREVEDKFQFGFAPASKKPDSSCNVPKAPQNVVPSDQDRMFDPHYNIKVGMTLLAYQLKRYDNDKRKAVIAYNQGNASAPATKRAQPYLAKFQRLNPQHPLSQELAKEGIGTSEKIASANRPANSKPASSQAPVSPSASPTIAAKNAQPPKENIFRRAAIALFTKPQLRPRTMSKAPSTSRSVASRSLADKGFSALRGGGLRSGGCGCSAR